MTRAASPPRLGWICVIAPWLSLILFGAYSVYLGQDANFDQRNYHFYNAYALLHGRLTYDRIPAHSLTFLPNLYNLPFYFMAQSFDPRVTGFVLGAMHGINGVLVFLIARALLTPAGALRTPLAVLAAVVGVWSPAAMSELGTTFGDNVMSIFVLAAILLATAGPDALARRTRVAAAGLTAGAAAGMKYTNAAYAIAFLVALGWLALARRASARTVILAAACVVMGALIADGFWMWRLWRLYRNPVFPFLNAVFRSPYLPPIYFRDPNWTPVSIVDGLRFPFYFLTVAHRRMEMPSRDVRWAVLAILGAVGAFRRAWRRQVDDGDSLACSEPRTIILVFGLVSFVVWELVFGYQRYLVLLELLSGVLLICVLDVIFTRRQWTVAAFALLSVLIVASVRVPDWGRLPWARTWFGVRLPETVPDDTMVLMVGYQPTAYVIPFFAPRVRFVRLDSDMSFALPGTEFARDVNAMIRSHHGGFRALVKGGLPPSADDTLRRYGLRRAPGRCQAIESRLDANISLCPVERLEGAALGLHERTPCREG